MARRKKEIQAEFGSVAEFVQYCDENKREKSNGASYDRPSFCPVSFADAVKFGINGDSARASALFEEVAAVKSAGDSVSSSFGRDVTGQFFDVSDVLAGVPEAWFCEEMQPSKQAVDIYFNFTYYYGYTLAEVNNRGAALVTLIDALTAGGYIPNITLYCTVEEYGKTCKPLIHVANDPLDIDAIAFAACNPAMCRRAFFAYQEYVFGRDNCGGYGPVTEHQYRADGRAADAPACVLFDYGISGSRYDNPYSTRTHVEYLLELLANGEKFVEAAR